MITQRDVKILLQKTLESSGVCLVLMAKWQGGYSESLMELWDAGDLQQNLISLIKPCEPLND